MQDDFYDEDFSEETSDEIYDRISDLEAFKEKLIAQKNQIEILARQAPLEELTDDINDNALSCINETISDIQSKIEGLNDDACDADDRHYGSFQGQNNLTMRDVL